MKKIIKQNNQIRNLFFDFDFDFFMPKFTMQFMKEIVLIVLIGSPRMHLHMNTVNTHNLPLSKREGKLYVGVGSIGGQYSGLCRHMQAEQAEGYACLQRCLHALDIPCLWRTMSHKLNVVSRRESLQHYNVGWITS